MTTVEDNNIGGLLENLKGFMELGILPTSSKDGNLLSLIADVATTRKSGGQARLVGVANRE
jgi:hypothetical protein